MIFNAEANPNSNVIEEMLARYDLLVAGHGYKAFIKNSSGVYRHSVVPSSYVQEDNAPFFLVLALTMSAATALGLTLLAINKKRKRDQR